MTLKRRDEYEKGATPMAHPFSVYIWATNAFGCNATLSVCTVISLIDTARLRLSDDVVRKNEVCFRRVKRG